MLDKMDRPQIEITDVDQTIQIARPAGTMANLCEYLRTCDTVRIINASKMIVLVVLTALRASLCSFVSHTEPVVCDVSKSINDPAKILVTCIKSFPLGIITGVAIHVRIFADVVSRPLSASISNSEQIATLLKPADICGHYCGLVIGSLVALCSHIFAIIIDCAYFIFFILSVIYNKYFAKLLSEASVNLA